MNSLQSGFFFFFFPLSSANVCYGKMAKWGNSWKHFLNSHFPLNWQFKNWVRRAKNCSKVLLEFGKDFGAKILSPICSKIATAVISCHKFWPVKVLHWRLMVPIFFFPLIQLFDIGTPLRLCFGRGVAKGCCVTFNSLYLLCILLDCV